MARMSDLESVFCRTAAWRWLARRIVVPRVLDRAIGPEVLEIGCGSGAMAAEVLRLRGDDITHFTATDVDPAMVALAREQLAPFGDRAEARLVDASRLPFGDQSFDTVCSWLMLHHTIGWQAVVADAVRVLRPGGRFVGYDLPDTVASRAVHRLTRSRVLMIDAADLAEHLAACGLTDVVVAPIGLGGAYRFTGTRPEAT
jgi:ubiquinone/menaquinone biosynthesis C-methylase UbiE